MISHLGALPSVAALRGGIVSAPAAAALRSLASAGTSRTVAPAVLARSYPQALGRAPTRPPMTRASVGGGDVAPAVLPAAAVAAAALQAPVSAAPAALGGGGGGPAVTSSAGSFAADDVVAAAPATERGTLGASVTVPDWTILLGVAVVVGIGYLALRKRGHV